MSAVYVVFGATGDLAQRKIMPALCALFEKGSDAGIVSADMAIIAFSRRPWSDGEYRTFIRPALAAHPADVVEKFLERIVYVAGTFDDVNSMKNLGAIIAQKNPSENPSEKNTYLHLAIQPAFYETTIHSLAAAGVHGTLLIEKPFGHDEQSAKTLYATAAPFFTVKPIDHYLGKKGLTDFINRRYTDHAFESNLTAAHVRDITITCSETLSIEGRGEFYDAVGAIRDVGQNHVLTMLASVLMDLPTDHPDQHTQDAAQSHARAAALAALAPFQIQTIGQYEGYTQEEGVQSDSTTETYFHLTTTCTTPRWNNVPITLIAGKALDHKRSEITLTFHDGSTETIDIDIPKKPDAYETIINAALKNDASYFQTAEEIDAAWNCIDPIITKKTHTPRIVYPKQSRAMLGA